MHLRGALQPRELRLHLAVRFPLSRERLVQTVHERPDGLAQILSVLVMYACSFLRRLVT